MVKRHPKRTRCPRAGGSVRITRLGTEAYARNHSAAKGFELAVENRGQTQTDQDWLRGVAQMDLHLPAGAVELPNALPALTQVAARYRELMPLYAT